ncbi:MAG: hypothetical protein JRL30_26465 [Deltaproteobacteria bacterium]|nr:hypothetical protein [Deltaproteobacteria bacterium]
MQGPKKARILLLGKRNNRVKRVEGVLKKYLPDTKIVSKAGYPLDSSASDDFKLVVITDASKDSVDAKFVQNVRHSFPQAKVVSLYDEIDPEIEIDMRSAGLIFLGSYEHFIRECADILRSAVETSKGT